MMSKITMIVILAIAIIQLVRARMFCGCDIEYTGQDPEFVLTEVRTVTYREYEEIKTELTRVECGDVNTPRYQEKMSLLNELEEARYRLDEILVELNISVLKLMEDAYFRYGSTSSVEYTIIIGQILSETENELKPYLRSFRKKIIRSRSFVGNILGGVGSMVGGLLSRT